MKKLLISLVIGLFACLGGFAKIYSPPEELEKIMQPLFDVYAKNYNARASLLFVADSLEEACEELDIPSWDLDVLVIHKEVCFLREK